VSETELDIADDISVLNGLIAGYPVENGAVVRVVLDTGGLADVVTSREDLVVLVGSNPETLAGEGSAVIHDTTGLGEETGAVVVEDLVSNGLLGGWVDAVRVGDGP
jgi:hypothetical protein